MYFLNPTLREVFPKKKNSLHHSIIFLLTPFFGWHNAWIPFLGSPGRFPLSLFFWVKELSPVIKGISLLRQRREKLLRHQIGASLPPCWHSELSLWSIIATGGGGGAGGAGALWAGRRAFSVKFFPLKKKSFKCLKCHNRQRSFNRKKRLQ